MYTFHLRRSDEAPTGLEAFDLAHDAAAFRKASDLLDDHPSCDHVEVWDSERPVVARHREQPIIRPIDERPSLAASTGRPQPPERFPWQSARHAKQTPPPSVS
jgi:hypothetical protein